MPDLLQRTWRFLFERRSKWAGAPALGRLAPRRGGILRIEAIGLFALLLWAPLLADGAAVATYEPTRDTFMRGPEGGDQQLHGDAPSGRASKSFLDFYIADFNRAAINSFIQTELGHPLTVEDMDDVRISLNLFSNDFQGYQPTALSRPAVFQGMRDWVEGTALTPGATKNFAVYDPAAPGNSLRWTNIAGAEVQWFFNLDKIENASFEEWGGQPFSFREWVLDDNVAFAFLTDPFSRGLFLNASDAENVGGIEAQYSNTEVYSREAGDPLLRPFLKVDVIPEPGSSLLLGIGALLVGLHKRRQG